ncbi:MAG: monovalent cation/H+ antiporter complex subunit F [Methanomicrobiales archaeon]|jgi:multicomponent Na+:H+ antiporter subunit F|nr:monovalent cation/H+ antiporter complex subunit F [Methanomicrobiales archaeon]
MTDPWLALPFWYPVVAVLLFLALLATVRLALGPTPADRAVAVDTVNTLVIASLILLSVQFNEMIFIDVAIVYAILSFVSTLFIAKYIGGELSG